MKKIINTPNAPAAIGPYSQAVVSGEYLFTSGQIAINPVTGELVQGDITVQTRQVMDNIKAILGAAGMDMANILKTTVYVKDINDFTVINEIYAMYFDNDPPARSLVEVSRLPKNVSVEIDVIATCS